MSLTSQLETSRSELAVRFRSYRPSTRPESKTPLLVPPRSKRYSMVGTAFDYLFRFELQRLAPNVVADRWVAESVPDLIFRRIDGGRVSVGSFGVRRQGTEQSPAAELPELANRARAVIAAAKQAVQDYVQMPEVSAEEQRGVAGHAVRLARLDPMARAGYLDQDFAMAPEEDVEDILGMLGTTPVERFIESGPVILNPRFGQSSKALGGADADFIAGDLLVDIKVKSKCGGLPAVVYDQLLAYVMLCRLERSNDSQLPDIRRAGLLFPRQGYLWTVDVAEWESMAGFGEFEAWFRRFLDAELHRREEQVVQVRQQFREQLTAANERISGRRREPRRRATVPVSHVRKGRGNRAARPLTPIVLMLLLVAVLVMVVAAV